MSTMVIRAGFPLGTFLGHVDVGRVAPFPDTARLHAALLHAASKGSVAEERDGDLRPTSSALAALRWLEEHSPTAIAHPDTVATSGRPARSWRAEGVFESKKKPSPRKMLKSQSDAVAVGGSFGWEWADVPEDVFHLINAIAADVSCLGEADSPVVLRVAQDDEFMATHHRDKEQLGFPAPGGLAVRTPVRGRVDELEADYEAANPRKRPSFAADRPSWGQRPGSFAPADGSIRELSYRPVKRQGEGPWADVVVVESDGVAPRSFSDPHEAVRWSVAFHRALATTLGDSAPPLVTGIYPQGARQPANRVAIHVLPPNASAGPSLTSAAYLVLIPAGATAPELAVLQRAIGELRTIHRSVNGVAERIRLGGMGLVPADRFWRPPAAGMHRFWRPVPALVPEVRRQQTRARKWGLADAALLSVGYVFRERILASAAGSDRLSQVELVKQAGVAVHDTHPIRDSRVDRYAHKTREGITVQPYAALVDLGDLVDPRTLLALGQSRHLGGGLMYPEDLSEPVARSRRLL